MPLSFDASSIEFKSTPLSFGDSVLSIKLINNSSTNFAYPLAKAIPQTNLPNGTQLANASAGWNVFSSSWNTGDTATCNFYYNVSQNIPLNFIVTFKLYVSNFLPLNIDSCVFTSTFNCNLNPSNTTQLFQLENKKPKFIFSDNSLYIDNDMNSIFYIYDVYGKLVFTNNPFSLQKTINLSYLPLGVYNVVTDKRDCSYKFVVSKF